MKKAVMKCMAASFAAALFVCGCSREEKADGSRLEVEAIEAEDEQTAEKEPVADEAGEEPADDGSVSETGSSDMDNPEEAALKERFGEDCIAAQTFAVELNGCEGEVWFVPFAPSKENPEFHAQLMRDGEVLAGFSFYVPEAASGQPFTSLDAVSFWDVNFDGFTDIVMLATYGDTRCAAVYYGDYFKYYDGSESWSFLCMEELSDTLSAQAEEPLTIETVRSLLTGGKKNGEFTGYAEAYEAVITLSEMERQEEKAAEYDNSFLYDLIDVDGDEIPELVSGLNGYYVNLYTYQDGTLYTLMDEWGYGAMGNPGYEYAPGKNSMRNYNADHAGAIMKTYYMKINEQNEIETPVWIESVNFDDSNGNSMLDEGETYEEGVKIYVNDEEASEEELAAVYAAYDMGDYQYIEGEMTAEAVRDALREQ